MENFKYKKFEIVLKINNEKWSFEVYFQPYPNIKGSQDNIEQILKDR